MENLKTHFFSDTWIMFNRSMKHILRSIDTIITVCLTPIAIMLLFVYVFGGALSGGMSTAEYVNYSLPGILLISVASGVAYTALRLFNDISGGFFDRFKTMPISASSALWAHVLTSLVSNLLSLGVIFLVAVCIGFRTSVGLFNWLYVLGILSLFTLTLTWVAVIAGLKAKTVEGAGAFSYPLIFLPFISSAFLPTETMPSFIRTFAENQPVTAIVNSIRSLLLGTPITNDIWIALTWCLGILLLAYIYAVKVYKSKSIQ